MLVKYSTQSGQDIASSDWNIKKNYHTKNREETFKTEFQL